MNTFVIKIKNKLRSLINFFKINPHKHWTFLLYIFFILVSFLILFSLYLLYEIKNEKIFQVQTIQTEKLNLLQEDLLNKTINAYDLKAEKQKTITEKPSPYKDPSI
jgi:hypothetical protein